MKHPPTPEQEQWLAERKLAYTISPQPGKAKRTDARRCATCAHFYRHQYSAAYTYCRLMAPKGKTAYGHGKTKALNVCGQWKEKA